MKALSVLLALPLLVAACGERTASDTIPRDSVPSAQAPVPAPAPAADSGSARNYFDVKSGIIELRNSPATGTQTFYFDDYGRKQAMDINLELNGSRMHTMQIISDGWFYNYDQDQRSGKRSVAPPEGLNPIPDPTTLTQAQRTAYQYRAIEPRTLIGRGAEGYAMELSGDYPSSSVKVWHWNRVPLRMEMQMPGRPGMVTEAIRGEFDVPIPPERFTVPADVRLTDEGAHRH